jgi:hypothetical protein
MTGPSVAERPPTVDAKGAERSAPATAVKRSSVIPAIFSSWRDALRHLLVWVGGGLLLYAVLLVGWLIAK